MVGVEFSMTMAILAHFRPEAGHTKSRDFSFATASHPTVLYCSCLPLETCLASGGLSCLAVISRDI